MNPLSPAQQTQVKAWTEQRDSLLREIGTYTTERDERKKEADAEALRLTDLHRSISDAEGRLSVLERLVAERKNSVSIELSELIARKSRLEGEVSTEEAKLKGAKSEHQTILAATAALTDAHGIVKDQTDAIGAILSNIKTTSIDHLSESKVILAETKAIADTVLDRANENLDQTKIVIEKMPKFIFDMQKPIPVRRTYPAGHPNEHLNENPA